MTTELDEALEKVLNEITNINPNVSQAFIIQDGKIISKEKFGSSESKILEAVEELSSRIGIIKGVESVIIQGSNGRLDINQINGFQVTTVTSKQADPETIDNLTHVQIPGIFKIIQTITPNQYPQTINPPTIEGQAINNSPPSSILTPFSEIRASALQYGEFTVENVGGLGALSSSTEIVKLDAVTFGRWTEAFGENKTFNVSLKVANTGITIECKGELSKDSKQQRGRVFLPELIQRKLNTKKGAKILVKPLIDQEPKDNLKAIEKKPAEQTSVALNEPQSASSKSGNMLPQETTLETGYSEFVIDDMSKLGMISAKNTVKLSIIAVGHWVETYGSENIQDVLLKEIKTGETVECKLEVSKDQKQDRNAVRIPEPLQRKLHIKKGSKILVKPIIRRKKELVNEKSISERSEVKSEKRQASKSNIENPFRKTSASKSLFLSNSSNCQLMVENVSGFGSLRESDVVRFDKALVLRWSELYGDRKIDEVKINEPNLGKYVKTKFKIMDSPRFEGKGLIQVPKSIQKQLTVKEGSLVIIEPVLK